MKMCPNCRNQISDEAVYCPICGSAADTAAQYQQPNTQYTPPYNPTYTQVPVYAAPVPYVDPYDHTAEFDAADIADTKVIAMLIYLLGPVGIIMALLAAGNSKYAAFHVRQAMKLTVVDVLAALALGVFVFLTALVNLEGFGVFVAVLVAAVLLLLKTICFLQICKGHAKEVFFIRKLRFLK